MSSATVDTINFASTQVFLYGYLFIIITGLFGNSINIIIFSSKHYRTNPCSVYFLTTEMNNCLTILIYLIPNVVSFITGKNGTESYLWWCKLMNYLADVCYIYMVIALCLASVDRYHSTSHTASRRQRSSMKIATISVLTAILVSLLLSIPDLIYWYIDTSYGEPMCINVSVIYNYYFTYVIGLTVSVLIPIVVLTFFGVLAYRNLKSMHQASHRHTRVAMNVATAVLTVTNFSAIQNNNNNAHVSTDQRQTQTVTVKKQQIDRQFSIILILQILSFSIGTIPACARLIYSTATTNELKSDMSQAIEGLFSAITYIFGYTPFCTSFYIYYVLSSAYRQNVTKILLKKRQIRVGTVISA